MLSRLLSLLVLCLTSLAGCTSTLQVRPASDANAEGVPFYLLEQHFLVTELGLAADGKEAGTKPLRVDLVTRADPRRGFRVINKSAGFTDSEFGVTRDAQGSVVSITGGVTDRTFETVQALISTARTAAVLASSSETTEFQKLDQLEAALLEDLDVTLKSPADAANPAQRAERIDKIQKALTAVRARKQELKAEATPKVGTVRSDSWAARSVVQDCRRRDRELLRWLNEPSPGLSPVASPNDVVVVLVPADVQTACSK